jgi:hypothetical protein
MRDPNMTQGLLITDAGMAAGGLYSQHAGAPAHFPAREIED